MTEPTQAMPNKKASKDDGVGKPDAGGRAAGGESGGGAYKDREQVKGDPDARGFMGHGGQSNIAYHGPGDKADGDTNRNAATDDE